MNETEFEKLEREFKALADFVYAGLRAKKSNRLLDGAELLELANNISEDAVSDLECVFNEIIVHRNPAEPEWRQTA